MNARVHIVLVLTVSMLILAGFTSEQQVARGEPTIPIPVDFGDLPEEGTNYPTTLVRDGARHVLGAFWLGIAVDPEIDGQPNTNALGDDQTEQNDEDGVVREAGESWTPGNTVHIKVTASTFIGPGAPGAGKPDCLAQEGTQLHLVSWFDWNGDGDFDESNEAVVFGEVILGENVLEFTIPDSYTTGHDLYCRFRLYVYEAELPVISPAGEATDGEVEDYKWEFNDSGNPTAITLSSFVARGAPAKNETLSTGYIVFFLLILALACAFIFNSQVRRR